MSNISLVKSQIVAHLRWLNFNKLKIHGVDNLTGLKILFLFLCCLMTPGLSKDIRCHV